MLQRDIAVISFGNNQINPYMHIPAGPCNSPFPPIYLGNLVNLHFQSFIPDVGVDVQLLVNKDPPAHKRAKIADVGVTQTKPKHCTKSSTLHQRKKFRKNVDIESLGEIIIRNTSLLVKENRRLHAYVKQLEWKLNHIQNNSKTEKNEDGSKILKEDTFFESDDATDELLMSFSSIDDSFSFSQ